ncbi:RidA family protein [Rhodococcus sp. ACT016]|uniref:RidA family protein n=1 Tax=Rhodococcus sp. ACT016 TaxID=3134808 RepID=UPI003D291047
MTDSTQPRRTFVTVPELMPVEALSHVADTGTTVYLSGVLGINAGSTEAHPAIAEQTTAAIANLALALDAVDLALTDVVQVRVYLADLADMVAMNDAYIAAFAAPRPARTTIGAALALGAKIEIDAVAVRRGQ